MKKLHAIVTIVVLLIFSSCNPKISTTISRSYPPLDYKQEVRVIGLREREPDNCEFLGQVKVGDSGFTSNCSYDVVIEEAMLEARKAGGNAIKIIEHRPPNVIVSSCHRITARILRVSDYESSPHQEEEFIEGIDYAILNVYRYGGTGSLINYDLYLGDTVICRVVNNFYTTLHITKDGMNTLWAKTEAKSEIPINLEFGKIYYLRCSITMGAFVGRPKLELVDPATGKLQFDAFKAKNK